MADFQPISSDSDDGETIASLKPKKKKFNQKFRIEWKVTWTFIHPSKKGAYFAHCKVCDKDLSIQGGGAHDIKMQVSQLSHKQRESAKSQSGSLLDYTARTTSLKKQVTAAELRYTDYIIEHNIPLAASGHASDVLKKMFTDSEIAKSYSCKRTKTASLVKCLGNSEENHIVSEIKNNVFCLATDGSNDYNASKLYPILVRYFSPRWEKIITVMLGIRECTVASTGVNIFMELHNELSTHGLSWKQVLASSTDNANVMVGEKSRVTAFIKEKNSQLLHCWVLLSFAAHCG